MRDLDDDFTDDLFKEGAERHTFEYNPQAWEQMEGMLDAQDYALLVRKYVLGGVLLLGLLAASWYYFGQRQLTDAGTTTEQELRTDNTAAPQEQPGAAAGAGEVTQVPPAAAGSAAESNSAVPTTNAVTPNEARVPTNTNTDTNVPTTKPVPATQDLTSPPATASSVRPIAAFVPRGERGNVATGTDDDPIIFQPYPEDETGVVTAEPARVVAAAVAPLSVDFVVGEVRSTSAAVRPERELAEAIVPQESTPAISAAGLALRLSAGAISGGVQDANPAMNRPRVGLTAEYRLANGKLAFGSGAAFNLVCYQAMGDQYTPQMENFWTDGIAPETIEARCDVLEVPLFVSYYPSGAYNNGFFARGGLTSYLMLTEKLDFNYREERPNQLRSWREDGTNNHIFGMGEFNFGYQRMASQRSALQVEGFVQAPLTGIGAGSVRLWTVGMSVNYQFGFRRR